MSKQVHRITSEIDLIEAFNRGEGKWQAVLIEIRKFMRKKNSIMIFSGSSLFF